MFKLIWNFIKFMWNEQDKLCPYCGYYCTNKTRYCIPPELDK